MVSKASVEKTKVETPELSPTQRYLLSTLTEKPTETIKEVVKALAKVDVSVEKEEDLGLRKLSFPVNGKTELSLISVYFQASKEQVKDIEVELSHVDTALRTLVTTWKADPDTAPSRSRSYKERVVKDV